MNKEMGFLDKMWDETLAGPAPETGLGKLRKYKSLSAVVVGSPPQSPRSPRSPTSAGRFRGDRGGDVDQMAGVSRSITILRTKSLSNDPGSGASSPSSTSSAPSSPFSPGEMIKDRRAKRFSKRAPGDHAAEATSPSVYDWIMISSLDR